MKRDKPLKIIGVVLEQHTLDRSYKPCSVKSGHGGVDHDFLSKEVIVVMRQNYSPILANKKSTTCI